MSSLFDLTGKSAIVTGSSRGIGKAIAHRLAEHGARVVVSSRKADACAGAVAEINAAVGRDAAIALPANIAVKEELQSLAHGAISALGAIDILVCNAASNPYYGPMGEMSDEQFEKILKNNIISSHWLIQLVAPQMRARRDGAIILISSVGGLSASPVIGAYNISKAADMQMARNLALEFGEDNVRVNTIAPGLIKTDFARALWENPEMLKAYAGGSCLKRIGEPDEIAGMAVLLASKAGAFATGQTFIVDGGMLAV